MPGFCLPNTPIAVDFWHVRKRPDLRLFFLTHCHADHLTGLSATWNEIIYCSDISAKLLPLFTGVKSQYIRGLSLGVEHLIAVDEEALTNITVTLFDAFHGCPGAVGYVFDGYFGRIVYTGTVHFCWL